MFMGERVRVRVCSEVPTIKLWHGYYLKKGGTQKYHRAWSIILAGWRKKWTQQKIHTTTFMPNVQFSLVQREWKEGRQGEMHFNKNEKWMRK